LVGAHASDITDSEPEDMAAPLATGLLALQGKGE
jgi:hypothetical protein